VATKQSRSRCAPGRDVSHQISCDGLVGQVGNLSHFFHSFRAADRAMSSFSAKSAPLLSALISGFDFRVFGATPFRERTVVEANIVTQVLGREVLFESRTGCQPVAVAYSNNFRQADSLSYSRCCPLVSLCGATAVVDFHYLEPDDAHDARRQTNRQIGQMKNAEMKQVAQERDV